MDWTKVVTEPLGLIGFALSLIFGVLGVRKGMASWWPIAAMMLAAVSIAGGLFFAFKKVDGDTARLEAAKTVAAPTPAAGDQPKTSGPCSPVYSGVTVTGNMEQNFDCSAQADTQVKESVKK
jgi:hypothetical protein